MIEEEDRVGFDLEEVDENLLKYLLPSVTVTEQMRRKSCFKGILCVTIS